MHALHFNRIIGVETDEVETAERRSVLILFANRFLAAFELYLTALRRKKFRRRLVAAMRV